MHIDLFSAVFLIDRNDEVLIGKRRDFKKCALPGGKLEWGESFEKTAQRELIEETGITVDVTSIKYLKIVD